MSFETRWTGLREVLTLAFPAMLASVSWTLMQFIDTAFVGQLGKAPLAALGSAGLWAFTMNTFIMGVVGCVSTFVGQSLGRGELANCGRYAWQGIYISLAAGLLALALWPLSEPMFRLMPHSEEVIRLEVQYFNVRLLGYIFIAWQTALASFFQAVNRPMVPMLSAFIANAVNVLLDYLLIFGHFGFPRWEVAGAALATVISLGIQVLILQAIFMTPRMQRSYQTVSGWAFDMHKFKELFSIGWPSGVNFLLDVVNWGIFTSFIVGYFGDNALAAHTAAINIMHISFLPALGLNHAIAPIVGQYIGRNDIPTAKARTYTAMKVAMGYMFTMGVLFAIYGGGIIRQFFSSDDDVISLGHKLLILAAMFQTFDAINITVMGALRGAGDTRWMAIVAFIGAYFLFLPCALALAFLLEMEAVGAWVGATVYIIALSGLIFYRFHSEQWRHIRIFLPDSPTGSAPATAAENAGANP